MTGVQTCALPIFFTFQIHNCLFFLSLSLGLCVVFILCIFLILRCFQIRDSLLLSLSWCVFVSFIFFFLFKSTTLSFFLSVSVFLFVSFFSDFKECLVCNFKRQFSVFKKYFTYFNVFFHPYVFSQMFLNNNFQFLNTCTKRVLIFWICVLCVCGLVFMFKYQQLMGVAIGPLCNLNHHF